MGNLPNFFGNLRHVSEPFGIEAAKLNNSSFDRKAAALQIENKSDGHSGGR